MTDPLVPSLLQRLAQGDKSALADFYDLYAGLVNGTLRFRGQRP